jgi:hypothetical protein
MSYPVHYVPAGDVLPLFFSSYGKTNGESITLSGLAVTDIEIYKDGSVTQRASDAGYTLLDTDGIDFDSITGIHGISIDTGDNTDAGFYTVGAWFHVVVSAVTVDSQTVSFIAAAFRIMPAEGSAGVPKVDVSHIAGSTVSTTSAQIGVNVVQISTDSAAADNAEAFFDGTGYAGTNNVIPTVTTVSNQVTANVTGISGDSTAADNLEAALDGTGGVTITAALTGNITGDLSGSVGSVTGSVGSIAASGIAASSFAAAAIDAAAIAGNAIGAAELAADAVSEIADGVWDEARSGHTTQGTYGETHSVLVSGAAIAGTLSTTAMTTDLAEATDDHYNGRIIVWVDGVLAGQATNITDYTGATKLLTYTAVTEAPSAADKFVIY